MTLLRITGIDPTGSSLDRTMRCPPSAALPQVFDANESPARDRGTAIHKFLERVAAVGREEALAEVDAQWKEICSDIEIAKLADQLKLSTEIAVGYNWRNDTSRLLQPLEPRLYDVDTSCEVALTLDLVGVGDGEVYIGDYKGPYGWLPEPEQSMQLGVGALAVARIFNASRAVVEYIRIRSDGTPRKFWANLDTFGLENAAERIYTTMLAVDRLRGPIAAGTVPNVTEGPYCRYCPARQHCPAKTALIRNVLSDPKPIPYSQPLTPEEALTAYRKLKLVKEAISYVDAALYAYAKVEPIPLGPDADGSLRFFGELRRPGNEELDGPITHRVLTELYGGEAANTAVTMEVTKRAIGDVARKSLKDGEKITHVIDSIVDRVRDAGGSKRPETVSTIEFTVAPDGAAKVRKRKSA